MVALGMAALPSLRRQHLLSEFAGLKHACPEGIFISLVPDSPATWAGVMFVREGPYAPAVLRFNISFPDAYPNIPPTITFTTDMFHPLITPLTTYMYTTDIQDNGTVSATDAERLPPGGFSLRHGFPDWFGRGRKLTANAGRTTDASLSSPNSRQVTSAPNSEPRSDASADAVKPSYTITRKTTVPLYDVLKYLRSTFDTEEVLDAVPLDAAGNPGAWHAWRTHRRKSGKLAKEATASGAEDENVARSSTPDVEPKPDSAPPQQQARNPSDWNWDGVWELRVKRNIAASLSEPVLYGGAATGAAEDVIRFSPMDEEDVESIKSNLKRTMEASV